MKNFLAVMMGSKDSPAMQKWNSMSETERNKLVEKGKMAWGQWVENNKKSIVAMGSPLGKTKQIDRKGISDIKNLMSAYTVVQAESHEAAAKLFIEHPHFSIFPGDSVELMECLPIPT